MQSPTKFNYIKAHRKRWNMDQLELAFLLGYGNNYTISKIEQGKYTPSLKDLITLELLFEKAGCKLFPDIYQEVSTKLLHRLHLFEQNLSEAEPLKSNLDKLDIIRTVRKSIIKDNENRI